MHYFMPKQAARAKLMLDNTLMELEIAQRRVDATSDKGEIEEVLGKAIQHVKSALDLLS